jgi:prefoldin subunit 5
MTKEELDHIEKQLSDLQNIPNKELISSMDILSTEFDTLKDLIIKLTHNIDTIEKYYNTILKEYDKRNN